jgi:hypothetical protein
MEERRGNAAIKPRMNPPRNAQADCAGERANMNLAFLAKAL